MVTCEVCHTQFRAITRTHLAKHQLTFAAYLAHYPKADLGRKLRLLVTPEEAKHLYEEERQSLNAIAKVKGVHPDLIRRDLLYLGYKIRGHSESRYKCDYDATGHEQLEALAIGIWMGEGTKRGKRVEVTNCDPTLLRVWVRFLLTVCHVDLNKLRLRVNLHNITLKDEAESYWQRELGIAIQCRFQENKTKPRGDVVPRQPMGTAALMVNSKFLLELIQRRAVKLADTLM